MQANDPRKTRWPIATLVRPAISLLLIAGILWWLGGVEKIAGVMGHDQSRFRGVSCDPTHNRPGLDEIQMAATA